MSKRFRTGARTATALSAAAVLALSGCGGGAGGASTGDEQTLTVLHKWPEGDHAAFFEQIKTDFEAAHPGVTVEMTAVQDDPYKERIRVLTASRDLPDVYFVWPGAYGEQFFDAGLAADLSGDLDEEWRERLMPAALDAYTVDGQTYAVPISMSGKYMVYNTDLFAEHGVDVPQTYEQLLGACRTFSAAGLTPIAMGNQAGWPAVHYLTTLVAKNVPADVRAQDLDPATATYDHPGYEQALTELGELADQCFTEGANGISNDASKAEIQTGVVPMYYGESNIFSIFREANGASPEVAAAWDFFPFPQVEGAAGDQESLTGAPDGFVVNEDSDNRDLAVEFLDFFTSRDNGALMLEMRDRPSAVVGAEEEVGDVLPQLTSALDQLRSVPRFDVWLDMAAVPEVGQAWIAAGQAGIDGSRTPAQIVDDVRAASEGAR